MVKNILNNFFSRKEEDIVRKFFKKYRKLSNKYGLDFIAVLSIYLDNQEVSGEKEKEIVEKLNNILNKEKIGIVPTIKIIKK